MNNKIKEIITELEKGVKEVFNDENFKAYLKTVSLFHNYSAANCILIARQKPEATAVAGFSAWKKLNRWVKKGEHGIRIICPTLNKREIEENGKTKEIIVRGFKAGYVYDISQTGGQNLPDYVVDNLKGKIDDFDKLVNSIDKIVPANIFFEDIADNKNGYYSTAENKIVVNANLEEKQQIKTLFHEVAHCLIRENGEQPDKTNDFEVEAESVAYVVSNYLGIDTGEYSFPYIAAYGKENTSETLKKTLKTIQATADKIITGIENNYEKEN